MSKQKKFTNHLYYEVLNAHFYHYFHYTGAEVKPEPNCPGDGFCPYPPDFFKIFEWHTISSYEEIEKYHQQDAQDLLNLPVGVPKLENIPAPEIKYNTFCGIRLNLKQITVPTFDGMRITVKYKYHFYRVNHLFRYLFAQDTFDKAKIYNEHLKTRVFSAYPEILTVLPETTPEFSQGDYIGEQEFTTRRQCLAVTSLLTVLGTDLSKAKLTDIARLIFILSAKEVPNGRNGNVKIVNSNTYKVLKTLNEVSESRMKEDLLFIKQAFLPLNNTSKRMPIKTLINLLSNKLK